MLARYLCPGMRSLENTEASPILGPLNPGALPRARHLGVLHPRDTTGASRMLMDHGKPAADFQRVDAGIHDNPGTPYIAGDRRLTPV